MITEDYVSFEIAKFLKEKGFNIECDYLYVNGELVRAPGFAYNWNDGETLFADYKNECSAPTFQMVMKWLEEKHGVFCVVRRHSNKDDSFTYSWNCEGKMGLSIGNDGGFKTAAGACEAAIKYCLENLI